MFSKPLTKAFERPQPVALTPAETSRVAGGSVHKNDNSGPGPAPYNTPGNPDYGQVPGGSGSTTTKE